jgi:uncharacterized membrane protein YbhN (UPF0104 family)
MKYTHLRCMILKMGINKQKLWRLLKICIAIGLVIVVFAEVDLESVTLLWKRISVSWLLLSALALYASMWCMARRYWMLLGMHISFRELFQVVLYQNVMGNLITTAAGTAWYVGNLRADHNVSVAQGLFSLVLARFGDLLIWVFTLIVATSVLWRIIPDLHAPIVIVIFLLTTLISGLLVLIASRCHLGRILRKVLSLLKLSEKPFAKNFVATLIALTKEVRCESKRSVFAFGLYSLFIVSAMIVFAYSSLQVFEVRIGVWPVIFVVALTQIVAFVPIQVFGGLGLYDFTYLYLYSLFGVDRSEFAAVVVGLRLSFYLINLTLLLLLLLTRARLQRKH